MVIESEFLETRKIKEVKVLEQSSDIFTQDENKQYDNTQVSENVFIKKQVKPQVVEIFLNKQIYETDSDNESEINFFGFVIIIFWVIICVLLIKRFVK